MRYRITRWHWDRRATGWFLVCAGFVAAVVVMLDERPNLMDVLCVLTFGAGGLVTLGRMVRRRVVLDVAPAGVEVGLDWWLTGDDAPPNRPRRFVPWSDILAIELSEAFGTWHLGVERRTATRPAADRTMTGPDAPDPESRRTLLLVDVGMLNVDRLAAAVTAFGPDVPLLARDGPEPVRIPPPDRNRMRRLRWTSTPVAVAATTAFALLVVGVTVLVTPSPPVPAPAPAAIPGRSAQPRLVGTPFAGVGQPRDIAVSPDGRRAYLTHLAAATVSVLDTATGAVSARIAVGVLPWSIALSPDGRRAYVTGPGGGTAPGDAVTVIDTATDGVLARVPVGQRPEGVAVGPDGRRVYVTHHGAPDGSPGLAVIDTATNAIGRVDFGFEPNDVVVSPDGGRAYVSSCADNSVSAMDTASGYLTSRVAVGVCPGALAVAPDGRRLYVADFGTDADPGTTVSVIDTATMARVATVPVGVRPIGIAVTPDGRYAYVADSGSIGATGNSVTVIDTATGTVSGTLVLADDPSAVAFAPDGLRAYIAGYRTGAVSVIDPGAR